ncbi:winged helix family transcriptional regulator [Petralouisia muris]|uniref:Winged helix family transcriptional regulator n=1 Tax=Petralouisia muris TaxID=3032872 RepID=A0AC61RS95_9FIRM|nr:winged helix-turn-helix domain-containing protein [Petralouisia muris]TGY93485.1 winged helix family transcriptional regulator [Petralouisia muris]
MVIEFGDQDVSAFDEVMEVLKRHPGFEHLWRRDEPMVSLPGLEIYPGRRKIYRDRREIRLTAKEYDLLSLLVANKGRVLTYDQIYSKVWGEDAYGDENNAIGCHIRNMREKLYEAEPDAPFTIRCVREVGYCFEVNSE